mmetsp:Transcript_39948/g.66744  ORF Transcript_39948/g.66744 Transcript_39948/m.66744 type:complete len:129 (+) Transcript_39948:228-614(+)
MSAIAPADQTSSALGEQLNSNGSSGVQSSGLQFDAQQCMSLALANPLTESTRPKEYSDSLYTPAVVALGNMTIVRVKGKCVVKKGKEAPLGLLFQKAFPQWNTCSVLRAGYSTARVRISCVLSLGIHV